MWLQAPILDLLHRHLDGKGKQAKLKSPNELQVSCGPCLLCVLDCILFHQSAAVHLPSLVYLLLLIASAAVAFHSNNKQAAVGHVASLTLS